jgi:hypothetical protein
MTKVLHYFHITHANADYKGSNGLAERDEVVSKWEKIRTVCDQMVKPGVALKIFQEGVFNDKALSGIRTRNSPNAEILRHLIDHGAALVIPFEDLRYVEYMHFLEAEGVANPPRMEAPAYYLLWVLLNLFRDPFMAERVNTSLKKEEMGVLFLGSAHRIEKLLDPEIQVRHYFAESDSEVEMRNRMVQGYQNLIDKMKKESDFNRLQKIFEQVRRLCSELRPGELLSADPLLAGH